MEPRPGIPRLRASKFTPLLWLMTVFSASLVGAGWGGGPPTFWVQVVLAVLLCVAFVLFVSAYTYLLIKDRPALDSEEHTQAMARIAKGLAGNVDDGFGTDPTPRPRTTDRT